MNRHRVNLSLLTDTFDGAKACAEEDGLPLTAWAAMLVRREVRRRRASTPVAPVEPVKETSE
jgi:hypothetical protein